MYESKLVEHLKVLNDSEFSDFLRFVKAMTEYEKDIPEETFKLVKYIFKYINDADSNKLHREVVYKHVYDNQAWKNGKIEKIMSSALKVFKNYVDFKLANEDKSEIDTLLPLTAFYRNRKMHKLFALNIKQLKKYEQEIIKPDSKNYLEKYDIESEICKYQTEFNNRKEDLNLPETIIALDIFYLTQRLDLILTALTQNQYIPFHIEPNTESTLSQVLNLASHPIYQENLLIQLYKKSIELQIEKEEAASDIIFQEFSNLLEKAYDKINFNKFSHFCTILRNYCTKQYNKGRNSFLYTNFELFKIHLKQNVLYADDKIRASTMQNIVVASLKLKEFDFVKLFLQEHKAKITGTLQPELVWEYNMAFYYFETKKHKEALEILPNYLDLDDFYYILAARRLEIKILSETESNSKYDTVGNKIDAFKNFLFESKKNNRISELIFNMNNDFTDMVKQIRNTIKNDKEKINKLILKIEQNQAVAEREWLLQKLQNINNNR